MRGRCARPRSAAAVHRRHRATERGRQRGGVAVVGIGAASAARARRIRHRAITLRISGRCGGAGVAGGHLWAVQRRRAGARGVPLRGAGGVAADAGNGMSGVAGGWIDRTATMGVTVMMVAHD
eukprot:ctg_5787.g446